MKIVFTVLLIAFVLNNGYSQVDFNNYRTLDARGEIPEDFAKNTYKKISDDLDQEGLTSKESKIFLQGIHYGIDDILHSGQVVYGDCVSEYVKKIAEKLLRSDSKLFDKLRFYTIKSNESNAFSTDQGIIFVTTGLISKLESEAQLAFVLAHEISHYTEKHVVKGFEFAKDLKKRDRNIRTLSVYSKSNELEADAIGLKLYRQAGYGMEEIYGTFDVLSRAHLPFEEITIPKSYWFSSHLELPNKYLPVNPYEIRIDYNLDDEYSSHPNLKTRIEELKKKDSIDNGEWGVERYFFSKELFQEIRDVCRFESVRTAIINGNHIDALYMIYILEKQYPRSSYIINLKSHVWLNLAQLNRINGLNNIIKDRKDREGSLGELHHIFSKLPRNAIYSIAMRQMYNLRNLALDNEGEIFDLFISEVITDQEFKKVIQNLIEEEDSLIIESDFYLTDLKSILSNDRPFAEQVISAELITTSSRFNTTENTAHSLDALREKSNPYDFDELIVLDPNVYSYKKGEVKLVKSEKLRGKLSSVIDYTANQHEITTHVIDREEVFQKGTITFNERNILLNYLTQVVRSGRQGVVPVDYSAMENLKARYNSSKIMFVSANHYFHHVFFQSLVVLPAYPIASIVIPLMVVHRNNTIMNFAVMDFSKRTVEFQLSYTFNHSPRKYNLGAHIYAIFDALSVAPQ